ncbi:MAG: hypothetical protein KAJ14_01980, partial [Candidatus Omnitrophica bacterium]|nr:hypothetical protein [Candidatus Omnitrophota bacterium]
IHKLMAISISMLYVVSYFGLVPTIGVAAYLGIGVFLFVSLITMKKGLDKWLKISNHDEPARPDAGVVAPEVETNRKAKLARYAFWVIGVILPKMVWNYYVFTFLGMATKELWPVVLGTVGVGASLNIATIIILWVPFIIFFLLDIFSFFYIAASIVGYWHGEYMGVGKIKLWKQISGVIQIGKLSKLIQKIVSFISRSHSKNIQNNDSNNPFVKNDLPEISKMFLDKFVPASVTITEEAKKVVWAKAWNLIIETLYEQDKLTEEEKENYKYGLLNESESNFFEGTICKEADISKPPKNEKAEQRIRWFCTQVFMSKPGAPISDKLFSLNVFTPVGNEDMLYTFYEITRVDNTRISPLNKFIHICPDEWDNFIDRMKKKYEGRQESIAIEGMREYGDKIKKGSQAKGDFAEEIVLENEALQREVRLWVSYRYQPFARTVRGVMYYKDVLTLFERIQFPEASEEEIKAMVSKKFRYTIALDFYYRWRTSEKSKEEQDKGKDIEWLMEQYPDLFEVVHISKDDNGWYTSLAKGESVPGTSEVRINQGLDDSEKIR